MDIAIQTLRAVSSAVVDPSNALIIIMISIIFYSKNKKIVAMQKMIMGEKLDSPFELTISQIVIGIIAGAVASLMFTYSGLVFEENSNIYLLFMVSLFFMAFKPRFICFSYSGAVLGMASLLFKYAAVVLDMPKLDVINIDILTLMTLVGILHIIEGSLVMLDGSRGAIPVFTSRNNRIIGGFALKRYWALPISLLILLSVATSETMSIQNIINTEWTHLIRGDIALKIMKNSVIATIALYGVIAYSSVTFTKSKKKKTFVSGCLIISYGILLAAVAQLAAINIAFEFFVLVFAAVAHEAMLRLEKYMELTFKPKFISDEDGIMVLEVVPSSPASDMGIQSGDLIMELNDKEIDSDAEIFNIIKGNFNSVSFKIKKAAGAVKDVSYSNLNGNKRLGIVVVPREVPKDSEIVKVDDQSFKNVMEKLKKKDEE
ncbi:PDZ domain-containing protein [Clostridium sp.]|uniref:PDZ domain-containing protein n=1 Tax=Clostridium sp. TaxID=1506 RepID=UPI003F4C0FBB